MEDNFSKDKKNIVHYWGGCPTFITSKWISYLRLINKCNDNGWENWLVLSEKPNDPALIEPIINAGCKIIYQPRSKGNFDFISIYRNFKFLRKIKCDVFHCYNDHTSPLIAAMLAKVPVRIWSKLAMSSYYEQGISPKGVHKLMPSTWVTCFLSSRVLAISDVAKDEICKQVGFKSKIVTVYVPVSLDRFISAEAADIRGELGLSPSDLLLISVGRAVPVKGWDIAVDAFEKVCKFTPNAKLLLVGDDSDSEYYQKICMKIEEYGLQGRVLFTGCRNNIPEILKACDLFILPSRSEGTPAALIEAMAVGLPCIAARTGGIPEVIRHGKSGLLFQRENAGALAEQILLMLSDPKLQLKVCQIASQDLHKFAMDLYVNTVFFHYKSLLNQRR